MMELYAVATTVFGLAMLLLTTWEFLRKRMGLLPYAFWTVLWLALILVGTVPQFYSALLLATQALGMYTPIHFVTTFSILVLFVLVYILGKRASELDDKLSMIVQQMALQNVDIKRTNSVNKKE